MSTVATPTTTYFHALNCIRTPRALMGGTTAMRQAAETYLPQMAAESASAYKARLLSSTLFNGLGKTVKDMTGKVFRRPLVLKDDVPDQIKKYAEDIDLTGRHLNVFARDVFHDVLQTGIGYILTDMQRAVTRDDGRPVTVADERRVGNRPYLVYIPLEKLIGWKSERIGGVETLTQVRIKECISEPDGDFGEREIEQIRVLEPGRWQIWRKPDDQSRTTNEWAVFDEGTISLNKITLTPVYANGTGFMTGEPPLGELADLNIAHWQSQSDQRNILHVARIPILFGAGFKEEAIIEVGASSMVRTSDTGAKLLFVEHSGAAIGAGQVDIDRIELQMQNMGLQLLVPTPGQTATGEIRDNAKENSPLAMMAMALQDALEQALGFMAEYIRLGDDSGGSIEVNTDFGVAAQGDFATLLNAANCGQISKKTLWAEMRRRDILSDSFDPETELDRLESEERQIVPMNLDDHSH